MYNFLDVSMDGLDTLTVSVSTVEALLEGLEGKSVSRRAVLAKAGLDEQLLARAGARIALLQFVKLCRVISQALNDEWYGLLERPQPLGAYSAMATNAVNAQTLGQAIDRYTSLFNMFANSLAYECIVNESKVRIKVIRRPAMRVRNNFSIDSAMMLIHRFSNWLINERIVLTSVQLDYLPSLEQEQQLLFYGAAIIIDQAENWIEFDVSYWDRPIVQTENSLAHYLYRAPLNVYLPIEAHGVLSRRVRAVINADYQQGHEALSLAVIAKKLQLQPHTLRRQLIREGGAFHRLKAQSLQDIAVHLLSATDQSIANIAEKMAYTEPGAFIRAFKRWTGLTPLAFRKNTRIN